MKRTTKYVALDVHQASTVMSVRDQSGRVIARGVLPTEGTALEEFFGGMRGSVHVAFEEGRRTGSQPGRSPPLTITLIERLGFDLREQHASGGPRGASRAVWQLHCLPRQVQTRVIRRANGLHSSRCSVRKRTRSRVPSDMPSRSPASRSPRDLIAARCRSIRERLR